METKRVLKTKRHNRIRTTVNGTGSRPRLSVYRSNRSLYVQLIDDQKRSTIISKRVAAKNKAAAKNLGEEIAKLAVAIGIKEIVFDRGGNRYHGVIDELAHAAREGGLKF